MKSRLYDCEVLHARASPRKHVFRYRYFTFCLDLDEVDELSRKSLFFGKSVFKIFRFHASDFIFSGRTADLKSSVCDYARANGVTDPIERVELVAHMRTLGYAFNPAAFYFCYAKEDRPICAILEVTNTYHEKKAYFLGPDSIRCGAFQSLLAKCFYVSPFVDRGSSFDLRLALPRERLRLQIDSKQDGELIVHSLVTGMASHINDLALARRFFRHPLITIGVMVKIHYQAFKLFLKKVPYIKKSDRMELQNGSLR